MRHLPIALVLLAACGGASSNAPPPADAGADGDTATVAPSGQASWADGCPMNACNSTPHSLRGAQGSPTVDVECSLRPVTGGHSVFFRIAALSMAGLSFDESREGLYVRGFLPAVGQELRSQSAEDVGNVRVRGNGWEVRVAAVGPSNPCHVRVTNLSNGGFAGTIACEGTRDDATPPNTRYVRGGPSATNPDRGEFVFTNCATSE